MLAGQATFKIPAQTIISLSPNSWWLSDPPRSYPMDNNDLPNVLSKQNVKLTTHRILVARSRMHRTVSVCLLSIFMTVFMNNDKFYGLSLQSTHIEKHITLANTYICGMLLPLLCNLKTFLQQKFVTKSFIRYACSNAFDVVVHHHWAYQGL
jgi:hypothetical protein